jgi:uncharacterized DUF497 family protein
MAQRIAAFEWDHGNSAKCQKHGLTQAAIESCFARPVLVLPDEGHSQTEERLRAIGRDQDGRHVFIVFTVRTRGRQSVIRPISARYMHAKEIAHYEKENPNL